MPDNSISHYSIFRYGTYMGSAYGTRRGVEDWAASRWGRQCTFQALTEEEHERLIQNLQMDEESNGYFFRGQ